MLTFDQQAAPIVAAAGFQPHDGDPWSDGTYFTDGTGWVDIDSATSPNQLPGLEFWYDAAESPVIETGGAIERLDDISGNANHAGQASAGARPSRTLDAAGRSVIRFDGSDDSLSVTTPPSLASGVTVFVVFRMRTRSDFTGIFTASAAAGTDQVDFFTLQNASAASGKFQLFGRSLDSDTLLWQPVDDGGLVYAIFALGAGNGVFRSQDGSANDTYDGSFGTPDEIVLGARFASGVFGHAQVDLLEVGLYARKLSPVQHGALEAYLTARYLFDDGLMADQTPTAAGWDPDDFADVIFSRPSAAWAWDDENHILLPFASGEPQHVPSRGVLLAPQRTNLVKRSYNLTTGWTAIGTIIRLLNETGIDGVANHATTLTDDNGAAYESVSLAGMSVSSGVAVVGSWFIKKDANQSRFPEVGLNLSGGVLLNVQLNTTTGATATRVGSPTFVKVRDAGDWWWLSVGGITAGTAASMVIYPAIATTLGGASAGATGSIIVGHVQLEVGSFPTSPIPTNGSAVTRLADILTLPAPGVAPGEIGLEIGFELPWSPAGRTTGLRLFGSDDATGTTEEIRTLGAAAWAWTAETGNKGGTLAIDVADLAAGTEHALGLSLTDAEQVAVLDDVTELDDSQSLSLAHSDTEFQLGFWDGSGAVQMPEMWLRSFSYWTRNVVRSRIGA